MIKQILGVAAAGVLALGVAMSQQGGAQAGTHGGRVVRGGGQQAVCCADPYVPNDYTGKCELPKPTGDSTTQPVSSGGTLQPAQPVSGLSTRSTAGTATIAAGLRNKRSCKLIPTGSVTSH